MTRTRAVTLSIILAGMAMLSASQLSAQQASSSSSNDAPLYTCTKGKSTYVCSNIEKAASQGVCDATTKVCSCSTKGTAYDKQVQC